MTSHELVMGWLNVSFCAENCVVDMHFLRHTAVFQVKYSDRCAAHLSKKAISVKLDLLVYEYLCKVAQ